MNLFDEFGNIDLDTIEDTYMDEVYNISYINEILSILGEDYISSFSKCTEYQFFNRFQATDLYEKRLLFIINKILVISVKESDIYDINNIYIKDKRTLYFREMSDEAKEKIAAKYISYISRLEDKLEKTFEEIISG